MQAFWERRRIKQRPELAPNKTYPRLQYSVCLVVLWMLRRMKRCASLALARSHIPMSQQWWQGWQTCCLDRWDEVPALKLGNKIYKQNKVPQRAVGALQAGELAETHFSCFSPPAAIKLFHSWLQSALPPLLNSKVWILLPYMRACGREGRKLRLAAIWR